MATGAAAAPDAAAATRAAAGAAATCVCECVCVCGTGVYRAAGASFSALRLQEPRPRYSTPLSCGGHAPRMSVVRWASGPARQRARARGGVAPAHVLARGRRCLVSSKTGAQATRAGETRTLPRGDRNCRRAFEAWPLRSGCRPCTYLMGGHAFSTACPRSVHTGWGATGARGRPVAIDARWTHHVSH